MLSVDWCLHFAQDLSLINIIMEGESQVIIHALTNSKPAHLPIQQMIVGAKAWKHHFKELVEYFCSQRM